MKRVISWHCRTCACRPRNVSEVNSRCLTARVSKWLRSRTITFAACASLTSADELDVTACTTADFQTARFPHGTIRRKKRCHGRPRVRRTQRRSDRKSAAVPGTRLHFSCKVVQIIIFSLISRESRSFSRISPVSKIYQCVEMFCKGTTGIWRLRFRYYIIISPNHST